MPLPPQSLHVLRRRPCSQKLPPPQSLHRARCRPCSQRPLPPHSLHLLRRRPCSQMALPPQSLHWVRCRPCSQMLPPPQSLHLLRSRPCSHFFFPMPMFVNEFRRRDAFVQTLRDVRAYTSSQPTQRASCLPPRGFAPLDERGAWDAPAATAAAAIAPLAEWQPDALHIPRGSRRGAVGGAPLPRGR